MKEQILAEIKKHLESIDGEIVGYGFSALWLKDKKNKIYEYDGFGHSGACSVVCSLLQELIRKENNADIQS